MLNKTDEVALFSHQNNCLKLSNRSGIKIKTIFNFKLIINNLRSTVNVTGTIMTHELIGLEIISIQTMKFN